MYVDNRTLDLFSGFPREVGNPYRRRIFTEEQFSEFVALNNGVSRDLFSSVYPSNHVIDKLFLDFDCSVKKYPDLTMTEVFNDFCKCYGYVVGLGLEAYPLVTGKKGYHLHIPLIPTKYSTIAEARKNLWLATFSLLYECGLVWFDYNDAGVREWFQSNAIDTSTIGDIEQLCRVPNTLRVFNDKDFEDIAAIPDIPDIDSGAIWCTWLPSYKYDIRDMSVTETFEWAKRYHLRDDKCTRTKQLKFFLTREEEFFRGIKHIESTSIIGSFEELDDKERMLYSMLKPFIPKSVIARVIHPEADHESRFVTALAMLESGLSVDFIVNLLSFIGWSDWNVSVCRYQVEQIDLNRGIRYKYTRSYGAAPLGSKGSGTSDKF